MAVTEWHSISSNIPFLGSNDTDTTQETALHGTLAFFENEDTTCGWYGN